MSELDPRLQRLFRAAARAPHAAPDAAPPFGFETRVLAHWATCKDLSTAPFFRRAFLVCSAVMLLTVALSYSTWTASASTETTLADSAIEMSLP